MKELVFVAVLSCLAWGVNSAHVHAQENMKDDIMSRMMHLASAYNQGDMAGVENAYAGDARVMPPNQAKAVGRKEIRSMWENFASVGITNLSLSSTTLSVVGDAAYQTGVISISVPDQNSQMTEIKGDTLVVWVRSAAKEWQIMMQMWNVVP